VDAIQDLEPGRLSRPIDLSGKRHLFMVAEKLPPEYAPLEDVEDEIRQALYPHVTEEEMREHFEENPDEFATASGGDDVSHILLVSREDAETVLEEIRTGEATFDDIAGSPRNMDKVAAARGGKVEGQIAIPTIRQAIEKAELGKVYPEPVQSPVGWHVLRVGARRTTDEVTFEDVKERIEQKLLTEKQREAERWWIEELKNRAEIETLLEGGGGMGGLQSMLGGMGRGMVDG